MAHKIISSTITTIAAAYSSGDVVGSSHVASSVLPTKGGSALLKSITLFSKIATQVAWDIYIFNEQPTVASADNAALDIADAQMAKCIGLVQLASGDGKASASGAVSCKANIDLPLQAVKSKDLYLVVVVGGSWTATSTSDITIKLGVEH